MIQNPYMYANPQPRVNVDWIRVNGIDGARNHIVELGQTCWMMDNSDPVIYYKAVDMVGQPTFKAFKLEEIQIENRSIVPNAPDLSAYATKADLDAITSKLDKLISEIGGMNV